MFRYAVVNLRKKLCVTKPYYRDVLAPRYRDAEWVFCEYKPNEDKQYGIDAFCHELAISNYRMADYEEFK